MKKRWLFTDDTPLAAAIEAKGQDVVNDPEFWRANHVDPEEPESKDYPIKRILRETNPDVLVLVDIVQERIVEGKSISLGYAKGTILSWVGMAPGRIVVATGREPFCYTSMKMNRVRGCDCRLYNVQVYVTDGLAEAERMAERMFTAFSQDMENATTALDAVGFAFSRNPTRPRVPWK